MRSSYSHRRTLRSSASHARRIVLARLTLQDLPLARRRADLLRRSEHPRSRRRSPRHHGRGQRRTRAAGRNVRSVGCTLETLDLEHVGRTHTLHNLGGDMDFTETDLRIIERDRDLPPDEPYDWATDEPKEDEDDQLAE